MNKYSVMIRASRASDDPEKMVIPGIVFISTMHQAFKEDRRPGFIVYFGWWDFSFRFGIIKNK